MKLFLVERAFLDFDNSRQVEIIGIASTKESADKMIQCDWNDRCVSLLFNGRLDDYDTHEWELDTYGHEFTG
jgi:hypothetical protein